MYARLRRLLRQLFEQDRRQWFSGKIDSANRCRKRVVAQIFAQQTWNGVDQADLGDIPQTRQIEERVGQHHLTAAGKRSENLEYGEIEADRGRCQDARKLVTGEVVGGPLHTGGGIAMRDRHALRSTRRARCIDDIGKIGRIAGVSGGKDRIGQFTDLKERQVVRGIECQPVAIRQHDPDCGILRNEGKPFGRVVRVERHIGRAGF